MATPLVKKLRLQEGQCALILNAPEGYVASLEGLPEGVEITGDPEGQFDFVHLFVKNSQMLAEFRPVAMAAVKYDGLLWISYPKRSAKVDTDLNRDILWDLMKDSGLRPVTQISIDAVWSALRFRPAECVGSKC